MKFTGSFGQWLKQRRRVLDLTQQDLADQINYSVVTIRKIEQDVSRPSKQIADRLADVLAVSREDRAAFVAFARRVAGARPSLNDEVTDAAQSHNLPQQSTPFVGRELELAQIADRLSEPTCRLLTLLGPGGIGKTRLALQAVADRVGEFADGVYFVSLAPVGSPTLIASAIASALQLSFYGQEDPHVQVVNYLRRKHMLLVMDNYEHLLPEISLLSDILADAPRLKILATSRERLNMQKEWVLPVEGLMFPAQGVADETASYSAVQLFVQTARRLQSSFTLENNQAAVADICRAVEGMPLGIELAATWLRAMPCQQIAGQISSDLDFLATPLRDIPQRHRSLRTVFEHSWSFLSESEQRVLAKLSVFRGGIDPKAAEVIADASLMLLAVFVDKSLVRLNSAGRYEMHELLRQFAADKLLEDDKTDETQQHHLQFFLELAEGLEPHLFGAQQLVSFDRLEIELDNFRAALDFASQVKDAESGLRLAGALGWFWNRGTRWIEGRTWLEKFLVTAENTSTGAKAKALHHILELSWELSDKKHAAAFCAQALTFASEVENPRLKAWLLTSVGFVERSQTEARLAYLEEALTLFRQINDIWGICETLGRVAIVMTDCGDFVRAGELLDEEIALTRQAGDKSVLSFALCLSACNDWYQGTINQQTQRKYQEARELFRELRYKYGTVWALFGLGQVADVQGDYEHAKQFYEQSISLARQLGGTGWVLDCMVGLANIFCVYNDAERATRILAAMDAPFQMYFSYSTITYEIDRRNYERILAAAHSQLDEATFAAAYGEGQRMTLDGAIAHALDKSTYNESL